MQNNKNNYLAKIIVKNLDAVKDAQGKAIENIIKKTSICTNPIIKAGKYYEIKVEAFDRNQAIEKLELISKDILSNPVIENYEIMEVLEL